MNVLGLIMCFYGHVEWRQPANFVYTISIDSVHYITDYKDSPADMPWCGLCTLYYC